MTLFDAFEAPEPPLRLVAPLAGRDQPTSQLAAALAEPRMGTAQANVLNLLRSHRGEWVEGWRFTLPGVGGTEGLRRCRQLTAAGWPIERRPSPDGKGAWEYRLRV